MKIEISPIKYQIEIDGYGSFDVSPLGAGAEADIRIAYREMGEAVDATKKFEGIVEREKNGEKMDKDSEEYKACMEAFSEASKVVDKVRETVLSKMRAVFKGKNVEKLFQDFTFDQILDIHNKATKSGK